MFPVTHTIRFCLFPTQSVDYLNVLWTYPRSETVVRPKIKRISFINNGLLPVNWGMLTVFGSKTPENVDSHVSTIHVLHVSISLSVEYFTDVKKTHSRHEGSFFISFLSFPPSLCKSEIRSTEIKCKQSSKHCAYVWVYNVLCISKIIHTNNETEIIMIES